MQSPFSLAVLAIDEGRPDDLRQLLSEHPALVQERGAGPDGHYFTGSPLLHYVAWNPWPTFREHGIDGGDELVMHDQMPHVVAALVEGGADPNAVNLSGASALSLLFTSQLASRSQQTQPIAQALITGGATLDASSRTLHQALANHAPEAAKFLLSHGASWDIYAAAGLGDLARLHAMVQPGITRPEDLGLAALYSYVIGEPETLEWLLQQPLDINVIGVGNGTMLHRAAASGEIEFVRRLLQLGGDLNHRGNPFRATPLDWADHAGQTEMVEWLRVHACDHLDLFQAAAHDLPGRAQTLASTQPALLHQTEDIWTLSAVQPLRIAVLRGHRRVTRTLVELGADVHHEASDGKSAVAQAQLAGDPELLACLLGPPA